MSLITWQRLKILAVGPYNSDQGHILRAKKAKVHGHYSDGEIYSGVELTS